MVYLRRWGVADGTHPISTNALGAETRRLRLPPETSPACTGQPSRTSLSSSTRRLVRIGSPSQGLNSHNLGGLHKYSLTGGRATRPNIVSFRKVALSTQDIGNVYQSPNQGSISTDLGSQARYCLKFPVTCYSGSPSPEPNLTGGHPYPHKVPQPVHPALGPEPQWCWISRYRFQAQPLRSQDLTLPTHCLFKHWTL